MRQTAQGGRKYLHLIGFCGAFLHAFLCAQLWTQSFSYSVFLLLAYSCLNEIGMQWHELL
jgi:hypothetical protein